MESRFRVLLVDSDEERARRTANELRNEDPHLRVTVSTGVAEAIEEVGSEGVDCVVSAFAIDGEDGLSVLDRVRNVDGDVPFILFDETGSDGVVADAYTAGVTDYVPDVDGTLDVLAQRVRHHSRGAASSSRGREGYEREYAAFVDNVPGIVYRSRLDDPAFEFVSGRIEEITGYTHEELESGVFDWEADIVHADDSETVSEEVAEAITAGERFEVTYRITTRDGSQRWVWDRGWEVKAGSGIIEGVIVDVTEQKAREEALQRERERFSDLFSDFPEPTIAYGFEDSVTVFKSVNDAFEEVFGLEEEAILDEPINDVIVPEQRLRESEDIDQQVESGEMVDRVVRRAAADGPRIFNLRNIPVTTGGDIDGFAVYRDITERKHRERELERYETIVETLPMGILVVDEDWQVVDANNPGAEMLGYSVEQLQGRPPTGLVEDGVITESVLETAEEVIEGLRSAWNANEKDVVEVEVTTLDGEQRDIEVHMSLLPGGGEFSGAVLVFHDITERKENERELRRQNERLEEFASIVSHDLRNPLNVAMGHLDIVSTDCDSPSIEHVSDALERMEVLIRETLQLAKQGQMVTETEPIQLSELVENCWEMVDQHGATLERQGDVRFRGDPSRAKQLFENLFRNAVEHGSTSPDSQTRQDAVEHAGEDVTIRVGVEEGRIFVEDDGPGIPEDERDDIFEAGHTTSEDGTGFGLAIVKEIVDAHDWDIEVAESNWGGARFELVGLEFVEEPGG